MSGLDDNIQDMDPSPVSALDETAAAPTQTPADDANSSPATGEDEGLLSVVRDVITESRGPQDTAPPAEGIETGQPGDEQPKTDDDENFSDVPFHKHPRFQQLLRQRNSFKQDAERYNNVQTFLDNAGLDAEEAADGLSIMGLMKTNPVEAWQRMKPAIQKLLVAAGEVLPADLQQMVKEGRMDQAAALEVSRARAGAQSVQVQRSFDQQRQQRQTQHTAFTAVQDAVSGWEADRRRKDPNFEAKMIGIQKEILFLQRTEGRPDTPEAARAQLEKAYKAVNDALPKAPPAPQQKPAIKPVTGGQVAGNQAPAAQSTLDIIKAKRRA